MSRTKLGTFEAYRDLHCNIKCQVVELMDNSDAQLQFKYSSFGSRSCRRRREILKVRRSSHFDTGSFRKQLLAVEVHATSQLLISKITNLSKQFVRQDVNII